jgi:hypothetical protein
MTSRFLNPTGWSATVHVATLLRPAHSEAAAGHRERPPDTGSDRRIPGATAGHRERPPDTRTGRRPTRRTPIPQAPGRLAS